MQYKGEHYDKLVLFKEVPYDEAKCVLDKGKIQELNADEYLLRPGQLNNQLYHVLEGKLSVLFTDTASETVVEIATGSCVGELSLIDRKEVTTYVKAYKNCKLLVIDQNDVWELLGTSKQFVNNLLNLFSQRMRYNTTVLAETLFVNTVPDIIYRLDKKGDFMFLNNSVEKLGYKVDELLGKHFSTLISEEDIEKVSYKIVIDKIRKGEFCVVQQPKLFDERRGSNRKTKDLEVSLKLKDSGKTVPAAIGEPFSFRSMIANISCTGINKPLPFDNSYYYEGTIGIIRDITEKKLSENQLKDQKARIEAIFSTAADSIIVIDRNNTIESLNHAATIMFCYNEKDLIGMEISKLIPSPIWESQDLLLHNNKTTRGTIYENHEEVGYRKNGSQFPLELSMSKVKLKDRDIFTVIIRDITERKRTQQIIYRQANYDALTGLPNRSLFMKTLETSFEESRKKGGRMALLFIDLDRFKWVNDNLGHSAGDQLLIEVSKRLHACVKEGIVARLGGDEFTVLISDMTSTDAISTLAKDIIGQLNQKFSLEGDVVYISGSLGISIFPDDAKDIGGLMKCSDLAMYRSKEAGKNAYHFFSGKSFIRKKKY